MYPDSVSAQVPLDVIDSRISDEAMNLQTERSPQTTTVQSKGRRPTSSLGGEGPRQPQPEINTNHITVEAPPITIPQRSLSVATLQPAVIEPRMAQLETLEAKMASIEVSLSSTPRRKKNGSISGISLTSSIQSIPKELAIKELEKLRNALRDKENIIQSLKGQLTIPGLRLNAIRNANSNNIKELTDVEKKQAEARLNRLKTDVDNKRLTIKNLKMALERLDITDNIDVRIQQAELEYQLGREELNLLTLLEETRALQLCIEESNRHFSDCHTLYSCVQENECLLLQAFQIDYDPNNPKFGAGPKESVTGLYVDWALEETNLCKGDRLIEVNGKIVLNKTREDLNRLLAAAPDPAQIVVLRKVTENHSVLENSTKASEVNTLRSELESLRERADEAQKAKEGLKSDNIRLTHRISYLEEQVSELLNRKTDIKAVPLTSKISKSNQNVTNINIKTHPPENCSTANLDMQIFQKGSHISKIESDTKEQILVPMRSKSSLSNVSNTLIPSLGNEYCQKVHSRHKHRSSRNSLQSPIDVTPNEKITYRKHIHHHHHHREKDYSSETNSGVDIRRYNKKNETNRYSSDFAKANSEKEYSDDIMDQSYKKATQIVHDLTRNKESTLYEKHRQKCLTASEKYNLDILRHYNARKSTSVLDFRSEVHIGPKYDSKSVEHIIDETEIPANGNVYRRIADARSVKSLDFDSDCNSLNNCRSNGTSNHIDYTSEPNNDKKNYYTNGYEHMKPRPTPPKKPLRLSLHKTHSLQSVETNSDCQSQTRNERKCMKRNYKGEIPVTSKSSDKNGINYQMKWNYRQSLENSVENGSWC